LDEASRKAHSQLLEKIALGLRNKRQRAALYVGTEGGRELVEKAYSEVADSGEMLVEARRIKRDAIERLDENLERFMNAAKSAGVTVHLAPDASAAVQLVVELARRANAKRIVKSKSMTGEEIELRDRLESEGFDVVETDLGERIVQLAHQRPSHMVAPAIHLDVEDVTELFSRTLGKKIPPDPEQMTAIARNSLRQKFLEADMGITGANFAVADSGAIVLVTNEGNARLVTALPKTNVAIFGMEKIVPNLADAFTLIQALTMSGAGRKMTSYVTIQRGGSNLAQTGQKQEQHVIIIDNGRSKMREDATFRQALYCLRCGSCLDICPTFRIFGGHTFGHIYTGPIGVPWTKYTATLDAAGEIAPLCISCGLCKHACPEDIDIPLLIARVKEEYTKQHGQLSINRTLCNYEAFINFASMTAPLSNFVLGLPGFRRLLQVLVGIDARRPFPKFTRRTFKKWFAEHTTTGTRQVAYFVDTFADQCETDIGKAVVGILEPYGCKVTVPTQMGSGMPAFLYGDLKQTKKSAEFNVLNLAKSVRDGCEIISTEPTATYCLKDLYPHLLQSSDAELVAAHSHDLFEYLLQLSKDGMVNLGVHRDQTEPVAYYPPCHTRSTYGNSPVLEVLKAAGVDARVVRYNTCCGIAGTFGFKKGREGYDVSMAVGETLFERLKELDCQLVLTESSVCKMQIEHGTGMRVVHPAVFLLELLQTRV